MASRDPFRPPDTRARSAGRSLVRLVLSGLVAAAVVVVDQLTKSWALDHTYPPRHVLASLWLELTFNTGAAFGLGKGVSPVVEAGVIVLVAVLVLGARRAAKRGSLSQTLALGLLVGGALSNLGDRLLRHIPGHPGAVVDWIEVAQVGGHQYWPVFNVADASVVVGAILLAWGLVVRSGSGREAASPSRAGPVDAASTSSARRADGEAGPGSSDGPPPVAGTPADVRGPD